MRQGLLLALLLAGGAARSWAVTMEEADRLADELEQEQQVLETGLKDLLALQARYMEAPDPTPFLAERGALQSELLMQFDRFTKGVDELDVQKQQLAMASLLTMRLQVRGGRKDLPGGGKNVVPYARLSRRYDAFNQWRTHAIIELTRENDVFKQVQADGARRRRMRKGLWALAALVPWVLLPALFVWRRRRLELKGYRPGEVVARQYRVLARVADPPLGPLYEAEDVELHRPVWLQAFHPDILDDRSLLESVAEGMRTAARLRHPNILEIYTVAQEGGRAALILERGPAASLADWLERGTRLSPAAAAKLFAQAAEALAYAHAQGVAHGGLEPGSVLIGQDGVVKLKDFVYGRLARKVRGPEPSPAADVQTLAELFRRTAGALPAGLEPCSSARALAEALRRIGGAGSSPG